MAVQHNLSALTLIVVALIETSSSASSCVPSGGNVRLVNGSSERSGRVELCWCNQWKAVCDDGWGIEEAITVCRELGYLNSNGLAIAVTGSHFGAAQEIHQLKQWNCQSTEATIAHCSKAIAHQNCNESETVGVYCQGGDNCQDGDIRLMNGSRLSTFEGRVEICFNGVWGTICSDGWDSRDATVVCRQLDVSQQTLGIAVPFSDLYGEGEGAVMLAGVDCDEGHLQRLSECERSDPRPGVVYDHCTHSMDAGVICRGSSNCMDGEIRLVGGLNQSDGMVEICFGRTWGAILACDGRWNDSNARVVCRQLGYLQGYATAHSESADEANRIQHLSNITCNGQESRLTDCSYGVIGVDTCFPTDLKVNAAVMCSELAPITVTMTRLDSTSASIASPSLTSSMSLYSPSSSIYLPVPSISTPSRIGVITGTMCGIVVVIIAAGALVSVVSVYMYVRRRKKLQSHELELSSREVIKQVDRDKAAPKEEVSTKLGDSVVEHNFKNPLYTQVCLRDQTNEDSLSHSVSL